MTSNKDILQTVLDWKLEFLGDPPIKHNSYIPQFSKDDESAVDLEIKKRLAKGVTTKCEHEAGEYISPIFIRQKLDGSCRLILNLKNLNEDMPYIHFKMETLKSVVPLITPRCYLASLDLKDAYYSVPVHPDHTKFLKFIWRNQLYKFLVLPNSLCCGPRKFTKLMNPPIATLRLHGHIIAIYIDDLINIGLTFDECVENVITSIKLLNSVGFIIHLDKSIFLPKQEITFLGFNINSQKMEITLTDTKKETLKACCSELVHKSNQTIRYVAKVIGVMTSSLPGIKYGAAHYKYLEQDKTNALKIFKGCCDAIMVLSPQSIIDVQWWYNKISCSKNNITKGEPVIEISSDASSFGWGTVCNNIRTRGTFNLDEMEYHINTKELLAAKFSLKTFVKVSDAHVKLLSGNTAIVHGISNMHSNKSDLCHFMISEIWTWAEDKNIWIAASYIPGKGNYDADVESRKKQTELEWTLNQKIFTKIISKFKFQVEVELFASRLNAQQPVFVSYHPDPEAMHINVFFQYHGRVDPSMHLLPLL